MIRLITPKQYAAERGVSVQYIGKLIRDIEFSQTYGKYANERKTMNILMTCGTGPKVKKIVIEKIVRWRTLTVTTEG